jgi:XTP/dITP diphosphohydrolase
MNVDPERTILVATLNPGKYREIIDVLTRSEDATPLSGVRWLSLFELEFAPDEPSEDGETFTENAALKARYYSAQTGHWTLADDSGLEVDALGGAPGVRSARYADVSVGLSRSEIDAANNHKLIATLRGVDPEKRTARFHCAMALADGDRILATAEGVIEGRIIDTPRGERGFGYDPHFLVAGSDHTTAELSLAEKNRISHRGQALRQMREHLRRLLR